MITAVITSYINNFQTQYPNYQLLYITNMGSVLYGTNSINSDKDIKGIFIPDTKSVLLKCDIEQFTLESGAANKNSSQDIDFQLISLYKFLGLLEKGETGALDMLFSMFRHDTIIFENKDFTDYIRQNKDKLICKRMKAFTGYAAAQAKKYGVKGARYKELTDFIEAINGLNGTIKENLVFFKGLTNFKYISIEHLPDGTKRNGGMRSDLPLAEYLVVLGRQFLHTNTIEHLKDRLRDIKKTYGHRTEMASTGIDNKALSHALRVAYEAKELLDTGFIKFPLLYADEIKSLKYDTSMSEDRYANILNKLEQKLDDIDKATEVSSLQDSLDTKFLNDTILKFLA
jgi:predicted nucleotidyltransferase